MSPPLSIPSIGWKRRAKPSNPFPVLDRQLVIYILDTLWLIWLAYWIFRAFGNKRSAYTQGRGLRLLYLASIFVVWYLAQNHGLVPHIRLFHENYVTQILGILFCAAGIVLAIWARIILGSNWSGIVTLKENHELITSGPYQYVRHPIYSSLLLSIFGTLLALAPFLSGIVAFLVTVIALRVKSLMEEKIMLRTFPEQYPQYKRQVRALIPYIW
jgi:protein-S-isoprenylcysteine O-methyltransferase Ste14